MGGNNTFCENENILTNHRVCFQQRFQLFSVEPEQLQRQSCGTCPNRAPAFSWRVLFSVHLRISLALSDPTTVFISNNNTLKVQSYFSYWLIPTTKTGGGKFSTLEHVRGSKRTQGTVRCILLKGQLIQK